MNLGCFHQDCIEKLKGSMYPDLPRTEGEIGNLWIGCMYRTVMRK